MFFPRMIGMKPYRNKKLLALAEECPTCMYCNAPNHGQVVACHFNSIKYGKGMGQKAHDITAFMCNLCHDLVDGRSGDLTKQERELVLYEGIYRTFLWLLQEGKIKVS